jgi:hypothetical protein
MKENNLNFRIYKCYKLLVEAGFICDKGPVTIASLKLEIKDTLNSVKQHLNCVCVCVSGRTMYLPKFIFLNLNLFYKHNTEHLNLANL